MLFSSQGVKATKVDREDSHVCCRNRFFSSLLKRFFVSVHPLTMTLRILFLLSSSSSILGVEELEVGVFAMFSIRDGEPLFLFSLSIKNKNGVSLKMRGRFSLTISLKRFRVIVEESEEREEEEEEEANLRLWTSI